MAEIRRRIGVTTTRWGSIVWTTRWATPPPFPVLAPDLGVIPVLRDGGNDFSRSAAGRCCVEGVWLPTALLPRFGARWEALAADSIVARISLETNDLELHLRIDGNGLVQSVTLDRWGDPDNSGSFRVSPFGMDVTDHRTFGGLTVPAAARAGWFHGTSRWKDGEFVRYEITAIERIP